MSVFRPTQEQATIIAHDDGHAIVSAVAGSGKSATLVERVAHLIERGASPRAILILMFNKSAAEDFRFRLAVRLENDRPEVFTFHGFGQRLCKTLSRSGLLPHCRLITEEASAHGFARSVIEKHCVARGKAVRADMESEALDEYLEGIDLLKGALYCGGRLPSWATGNNDLMDSFELFERLRKAQKIRFFADLIYDPVLTSLSNPAVLSAVANRFDHVLVDEFQDINEAQMALIRIVAGNRAKVMAVGDDDQTIYGWRGAKPEFMISLFEQQFASVKRFTLSCTFRYGHALSLMANACITNNATRTDKISISACAHSTDIRVRMYARRPDDVVIEEVQSWLDEGRDTSEIAILVREYRNALGLEASLLRKGISVRVEGAPSFLEQPEVLALRGFMSLAGGRESVTDIDRADQMARALLFTANLQLSKAEIAHLVSPGVRMSSSLRALSRTCPAWQAQSREDLCNIIEWASRQNSACNAAAFLVELARKLNLSQRLGQGRLHKGRAAQGMVLVDHLIGLARETGYCVSSLRDHLTTLASLHTRSDNSILITSVHRSKGLEWNCVLMPDLAEGLFPAGAGSTIEDERRLFYVGTTRARERLILISPVDRALIDWSTQHKAGHPAIASIKASRFLYESGLIFSSETGSKLDADGYSDTLLDSQVVHSDLKPLATRYLRALIAQKA